MPVEVWGTSGRSLVFLPGLGVHPKYYRNAFERVSRDLRIVVPDLSFWTHRRLPGDPLAYLAVARGVAEKLAPDAVWAGHSFGGLLALMSDRPAIACAPSVPAPVGFPRMLGRAVRQQLREYVCLEGWSGFTYAPRIMVDYVRAGFLRPRSLYPGVRSLNAAATSFAIRSPRGVVYLSSPDEMYRAREYEAYLDANADAVRRNPSTIDVRPVPNCHDWPITEPAVLARRLREDVERLA